MSTLRRLAAGLHLGSHDLATLIELGRARSESGVRIQILGPLLVRRGGRPSELTSPAQRALLGLLALHYGNVVPLDELIDLLWGENPPKTCRSQVGVHIGRLRSLLEPGNLVRRHSGFILQLGETELDLARFDALLARARSAAGADLASARGLYADALGCWRGPILADANPSLRGHPAAAAAEKQRVAAAMEFADVAAGSAQNEHAVAVMRVLAEQEPFHEGLHARLMIALAGQGEQAAALRHYEDLKQRLSGELGVAPGNEIQDAHLRILRRELPVPQGRTTPVPAQLPAGPTAFIGRHAELRALERRLSSASTKVFVISGTAGVGKTALALHWAHEISDRFPDGQLYVDLRGYDPRQPVEVAEALGMLLRSLGVRDADLPMTPDDRAARYRTELNGRHLLVVLDNAASAEQVRPLLPPPPGIAILTSRDSLGGLVALQGGHRLRLDPLPLPDSISLLEKLIGHRADDIVLTSLAEQCGRLPLALRIAAELAASRPGTSVAELAEELAQHARRPARLRLGGDPRASVEAVFSWSCKHLPEEAARAFRLLGIQPNAQIDPHATAALLGRTLEQTRDAVRFADQAAARVWLDAQRPNLVTACTFAAEQWPTHAIRLAETLFRYLDTEYVDDAFATHTAAIRASRSLSDTVEEAKALVNLGTVLRQQGQYENAAEHYRRALESFQAAGDQAGQARALNNLGVIYLRAGRYDDADEHHRRALICYQQVGDQLGEARSWHNRANAGERRGRYSQAIEHHRRALALHVHLGNLTGQANVLDGLGVVHGRLGEHEQALGQLRLALEIFESLNNRTGQAGALTNIGTILQRQGRYEDAALHHRQALALFRETGFRYGETCALNGLGETLCAAGAIADAHDQHTAAMAIAQDTGDRDEQARSHVGMGRVHRAMGQDRLARQHWQTAFAAYKEIDSPDAEGVAALLQQPRP